MYGSHYSSAGIVLHFLLRQEPFTSMAVNLQVFPLLVAQFKSSCCDSGRVKC